jgi:hypothetical protein
MSIYIHRNSQTIGPFDEGSVQQMLGAGQLSGDDLACRHGASQWQALRFLVSSSQPAVMVNPFISPSTPSPAPASAAGPDVAQWIRQNIQQPIEVVPKFTTLTSKIVVAVLFLALPAIAAVAGIADLVINRSMQTAKIWFLLSALLFGCMLFMAVIVLAARAVSNRSLIQYIDASGVTTRSKKQYSWNDLQQLKLIKARSGGVNLIQRIILAIVFAWMFKGTDGKTVQLIFTNGKANLAPLILDNNRIHALVRSIPVQTIGDV